MPRIYTRKARKTRYLQGLKTPADNKQGYKVDYYQPRDENDVVVCEKGETYYTWHPKGQPWQYSKEKPVFEKRKNEFEQKFDEFEERVNYCADVEGLEDDAEELRSEISEYIDELQSSLDSVPYQLQESHILTERIEQLNELYERI